MTGNLLPLASCYYLYGCLPYSVLRASFYYNWAGLDITSYFRQTPIPCKFIPMLTRCLELPYQWVLPETTLQTRQPTTFWAGLTDWHYNLAS